VSWNGLTVASAVIMYDSISEMSTKDVTSAVAFYEIALKSIPFKSGPHTVKAILRPGTILK
jgi:hypothetical protein